MNKKFNIYDLILVILCLFLIAIYFAITNIGGNLTKAERIAKIEEFDNSLNIGAEYNTEIGILYPVFNETKFGYAHFKHSKFKGYEFIDVFLSEDDILYKCASFNYDEYGILVFNSKQVTDTAKIECFGNLASGKLDVNTANIINDKYIIPTYFSTLKITYKSKISNKYKSNTISLENSIYDAGYDWKNNKYRLMLILFNIYLCILCMLLLWKKNKERKICKKAIALYTLIFIILIVSTYCQYILIK